MQFSLDMLDAPLVRVALAVAALMVGPTLYALGRRVGWVVSALNGFVLTSVALLVLFLLLPPLVETAGWAAVVAALLGVAAPALAERWSSRSSDTTHTVVLAAALVALIIHAAIDGVGLIHHAESHGSEFALIMAIILHRLPVGLVVWLLVRPSRGRLWASLTLGLVALATLFGFGLGEQYLAVASGTTFAVFQAFVGGSLLHVLTHKHDDPMEADGSKGRIAATVGAVLGFGMVVLLPHGHAGHVNPLVPYLERFAELAAETAPALLFGYLLAGLFRGFIPAASYGWMRRGAPLGQAAKGMIFGIPIPICSCGVVPLYQSLMKRGDIPATAGMAFLIATPELGIESLLISVPLLGTEITVARLISAMIVALMVGWLVGSRAKVPAANEDDEAVEVHRGTFWVRLKAALSYGFRGVVDDTAAWILVGLAVAAALDPDALSSTLAALPPGADVLLFAFAGIPIYVCASGATPLAAALVLIGASPGAAVAFLLSGPATNITTFGVLSKIHGSKTAALFGIAVGVGAVVMGWLVNLVVSADAVPEVLGSGEHSISLLGWITASAMGLIVLASIVRLGPSNFIAPVLRLTGQDMGHDHGHGGHDEHDDDAASCGGDDDDDHGGCCSSCAS